MPTFRGLEERANREKSKVKDLTKAKLGTKMPTGWDEILQMPVAPAG